MAGDLYRKIETRVFGLFEIGFIGAFAYDAIMHIVGEEIDKEDLEV